MSDVEDDVTEDLAASALAVEAAAVVAELASVKAEYAAFRANVVQVGHKEATDRGWCSMWRKIALRMGIHPDELPPTHANVTVDIGGVTVSLRLRYDGNGKITPQNIIASLGEDLRYGNSGQLMRQAEDWYTVTPEPAPTDGDEDGY